MRTTVEFEPDTSAAIKKLRRESGMGVSEAVNSLIRRGLMAGQERPHFTQMTSRLGLKIDVSNIGEALEILEGSDAR